MGIVGDLRVDSVTFDFLEDANKFEARRINVGVPSPDSPTAFHVLRSDSYLTLITPQHTLSLSTPLYLPPATR
jgi:hypothetical protein